jgi:hypothetical protein
MESPKPWRDKSMIGSTMVIPDRLYHHNNSGSAGGNNIPGGPCR